MGDVTQEDDGSALMRVVEAITISPADAEKMVANYREQVERQRPGRAEREVQELIADRIIQRYTRLATTTGAATGLAGVIPGLGTIVAAVGGASADTAATIKFQFDMCFCLAGAFGYDLTQEDVRHMTYAVALGSTLQKAGVGLGTQIGSKAGVKMLKMYLRGAALQFVKALFKKIGIAFSRKALEKALPFGVGVVVGGGANYALFRYVGKEAKSWFLLAREEGE